MPRASHSVFLYHHSALDKLLLVNAMGCSAVLSGISSHPQVMPSLSYNGLAPKLTPEMSVFRNKGFDAS